MDYENTSSWLSAWAISASFDGVYVQTRRGAPEGTVVLRGVAAYINRIYTAIKLLYLRLVEVVSHSLHECHKHRQGCFCFNQKCTNRGSEPTLKLIFRLYGTVLYVTLAAPTLRCEVQATILLPGKEMKCPWFWDVPPSCDCVRLEKNWHICLFMTPITHLNFCWLSGCTCTVTIWLT